MIGKLFLLFPVCSFQGGRSPHLSLSQKLLCLGYGSKYVSGSPHTDYQVFFFQRKADLRLDCTFLEGRVAGRLVGDFDYNTSTAQLGLGFGLSLAIRKDQASTFRRISSILQMQGRIQGIPLYGILNRGSRCDSIKTKIGYEVWDNGCQ